jgi:hypothetical protein
VPQAARSGCVRDLGGASTAAVPAGFAMLVLPLVCSNLNVCDQVRLN